jgi:hypothetical protein
MEKERQGGGGRPDLISDKGIIQEGETGLESA